MLDGTQVQLVSCTDVVTGCILPNPYGRSIADNKNHIIYCLALTVFLSWYTNLEFLAVLPDNDSIANRVLVNIPRVEGF